MTDETILPGSSMCGVSLGDSKPDVLRVLGAPNASQIKESHQFLEYEDLTVVLLDDSVFMLIAESPACGRTPEGIKVGAPWRQLVESLGDVEYDEEEGLWASASHPGVWYEVVRPAHSYEQPLDPPYVPELYSVGDDRVAHVRRVYVMR
ncbi:MAG: hypothetical protein U9R47_04455 [Actinomycetota bacterium]|nr:hypothetical protein [Actinomycetota bacterium]